jgi:hypothetical protein
MRGRATGAGLSSAPAAQLQAQGAMLPPTARAAAASARSRPPPPPLPPLKPPPPKLRAPGATPGPQGDVTFGAWAFANNKASPADSPSTAPAPGGAPAEGQENAAAAAAAAPAAAPPAAPHATPAMPRPSPLGPAGAWRGHARALACRAGRACRRPQRMRALINRCALPHALPPGAAATPMASAASCTVANTPGSIATTLAGGLATGGQHSVMARPGGEANARAHARAVRGSKRGDAAGQPSAAAFEVSMEQLAAWRL